jgi:putative acetyltransferase
VSGLNIRLERPGDADAVRETNDLAFGTPLEGRLVDKLRAAATADQPAPRLRRSAGASAKAEAGALHERYLSLVATIDDRVIGHILFTPVTLEPSVDRRIAGLAPMAVRPQHQRSGIGGQLIRAGLEECRRSGCSAVVVLGHSEYYPRFGFVPAHTFGLTCEFPSPPEAFMAIELEIGALSGIRGLVRYLPQFAEVS